MSRLEEIKKNLKTYVGEGIEAALQYLESVLDHNALLYNDFIQIKSRYNSLQRQLLLGTLDNSEFGLERNKISQSLLLLADDISEKDLLPEESSASKKEEDKRGELLYHVPETMQVGHEEKCTVRIAFEVEHLKRDWQETSNEVIKSIRISETMAVVLLNVDENDPPFAIRSFSETVQFVDKDDFTEWIFYVKPLRIGSFPLVLKVSVLEMINNNEYKQDIVLEEKIVVITEEVPPGEAQFKSAGESITLSNNPLPLDNIATQSATLKAARGDAGTLLKGVAMAADAVVATYFGYQEFQENQEEKAWGSARKGGNKGAYEEYLAKYPDDRHSEEAQHIIDSLAALGGDALSPSTTSQGSETAPETTGNGEAASGGAASSSEEQNQNQTGKITSRAPSSPANPSPSSPNNAQPPKPPATPAEMLPGQQFFFGMDEFTVAKSSGQTFSFRFSQYNQHRQVLAIIGSVGKIKMQVGMTIALVPEKGASIASDIRYVVFTQKDDSYDGYFTISPSELERLANGKFKALRLFDANRKSLGEFSLTGSKDLKNNAGKALRKLNE